MFLLPHGVAGLLSFAVALVASRLINQIETLPKPNGRELVGNFYQNVILPATIGVFVICSSDILVRLWMMQWHWFHSHESIPTCSFVLTGALMDWLGVVAAAVVTATLARNRATFAMMVGLSIYLPLGFTYIFSGDGISRTMTFMAKSCGLDSDSSDQEAAGVGIVVGLLLRGLLAIFVARIVSTWLARGDTSGGGPNRRAAETNL